MTVTIESSCRTLVLRGVLQINDRVCVHFLFIENGIWFGSDLVYMEEWYPLRAIVCLLGPLSVA